MLSDVDIEAGKAKTKYSDKPYHEHSDCIRMAYEWLDAQKTLKGAGKVGIALKHVIQTWSGRYISQTDVEVAATMHPRIKGNYPYFNLSARRVLPNDRRLEGIGEAMAHDYRDRLNRRVYSLEES